MSLPTRALLVDLAPQRALGVEASTPVAEILRLRLGVFEPTSIPFSSEGALSVAAADLELVEGLELHAAGAAWLHGPDAVTNLGEDAPGWDATGDLALVYDTHQNRFAVEGLVGRRATDHGADGGVGAIATHRFAVGRHLELEPAAGWDTLWTDGLPTYRATGALNLHQDDWNLVESVSWETEIVDTVAVNTARALLQAGF